MTRMLQVALVTTLAIGLGTTPASARQDAYDVLIDGRINPLTGFGVGVDDSRQLRNWISQTEEGLGLAYPGNLAWGSVFITVGGAAVPPPRPGQDLSMYSTLVVEMRGERGGECVALGIKDSDDPDDGSEPKVEQRVTNEWQAYRFELLPSFSEPRHPARNPLDLRRLFVVTELVFPCRSDAAATVYLRSIRFESRVRPVRAPVR